MSKTEWKKCVENTLGVSVVQTFLGNISGLMDAIDARAECNKLLTPEERAELIGSDQGWYDLFRRGGDLDPRSPGYKDHI